MANNPVAQYFFAVSGACVLYYLIYWYTLLINPDIGLSVLNRGMSMSTVILLGVVLILGPMSRIFGGRFWRLLFMFRKELGVISFFTGIAHVYLSMFVFARNGPFGFYLGNPISAALGLIALLILGILLFFSFARAQKLLPPLQWWRLQYIGVRITFVAILLHTVLLRYEKWYAWLLQSFGGNASLPPTALLGFVFGLFVLAIRIVDYIKIPMKKQVVISLGIICMLLIIDLFVPMLASE